MSRIIAYGYNRTPEQLAGLSAGRVYNDAHRSRTDRADMLRDLRAGDVVRVLFGADLGGPRWREWADKIKARGATVEEHRPQATRAPGRPMKQDADLTPQDHAKAQAAWCDDLAGLDDRLKAVSAIYGRKLERKDRHILYWRYGTPAAPKPLKEQQS